MAYLQRHITEAFARRIWLRQGFYGGKPSVKASTCRPLRNAQLGGPSIKRQSDAIQSYFFNTPGIIHLFSMRCPCAIFGAVVTVIVNAIQGISFRALAHITNKQEKVVPSVANLDSAMPIILKTSRRRTLTSGYHTRPHLIQWMKIITMNGLLFFHKLLVLASATLSSWLSKVATRNVTQLSAGAPTQPSIFTQKPQYGIVSIYMTSPIQKARVGGKRVKVRNIVRIYSHNLYLTISSMPLQGGIRPSHI